MLEFSQFTLLMALSAYILVYFVAASYFGAFRLALIPRTEAKAEKKHDMKTS